MSEDEGNREQPGSQTASRSVDQSVGPIAGQTPSQTVGPFFHIGMPSVGRNDLVREGSRGQPIIIFGVVVDGDGDPVADGAVEIWQADANGVFDHPADPRQSEADPNFRGFGRAATGEDGSYSFRTVKPGRRESGPPYVNVRVFARGLLVHAVTRLYFEDEAGNEHDSVLMSLDRARRRTLLARAENGREIPAYRFDIRLQGKGETVFFDL